MDNDKENGNKNNEEDGNKNTECCDKTMNESLSTMELENKNEDNSFIINNLSMDCDNTIEKNFSNSDNHKNKIDSTNIDCKTDSEFLEKKNKKSVNVNGSLETHVLNDNLVDDTSNPGNILLEDSESIEIKDNNKSPESSNGDKDSPSCSNDKISKPKSKLKKRHYRKSSDNNEDSDSKSGKKARDSNSSSQELHELVEESNVVDPENASKNSNQDQEKNSDFDDSDKIISNVKDDDFEEWSTASEEEIRMKVPEVLKKIKPKPNWFILSEMRNREIGNNRFFHRRCYGSLNTVQKLEMTHSLDGHEGCVNALNFSGDGSKLASGSDDLQVIVWDWASGKKRGVFETGHSLNVFEAKWLLIDHESYIVTCARDGEVRLLDLNTNVHKKLASHREEARGLATHIDNPYNILSVGDDGKILSIDIRVEKATRLMTVKENGDHTLLYTVHINPCNSNYFCVGGRSQSVKIFDRRRVQSFVQKLTPRNLSIAGQSAYVTSAVYNYNGTEILTSYNDDDIYLFDTISPYSTRDYAHKYEGHRNSATIKSVNFFGPKSEFIISGSDCGNIFFWDKNSEAIVQWITEVDEGVNRLEPHPFVPILATSGLDKDVKIWAPTSEIESCMISLDVCVKTNMKKRAEDNTRALDSFDSRMLTIFFRHINRYRRISPTFGARRATNLLSYDDNSDSSSDSNSRRNSDSQSDDDGIEGPQCTTS